jgi:hypothetical protein
VKTTFSLWQRGKHFKSIIRSRSTNERIKRAKPGRKQPRIGDEETGWLNELIIDSAIELILKDKSIGVFQSCGNARYPSFRKQVGPWTVILNTDVSGPGEHWVLFTSVDTEQDHV